MRLATATVHALHALAYLARHGGEGPVTSEAVVRASGVPLSSLRKALEALAKARVLRSMRGPHGGFRMARPPEGITLLEVVEAVEGPVRGQAPPVADTPEGRRFDSRLGEACETAAGVTRERLRRVGLAELAGGVRAGK